MMLSDQLIGNLPPKASLSQTILRPTKTRMTPSPYFRNRNAFTMLCNTKKSERSPMMAKILEVKTTNGSLVSAKIAGTESMANMMSLNSMKANATNSGVTQVFPSISTQNLSP